MGNFLLASPALSDAATLTAGSEAGTLLAINLQRPQPGEVWRTEELTDTYLVVDFGQAFTIDFVALVSHNGNANATWRIRAASSEANLTNGSATLDTTAVSMFPGTRPDTTLYPLVTSYRQLTSTAARWWRIDISDIDNPAGYFQAGVLILTAAVQSPTRHIDVDWRLGWRPLAARDRAMGGQLYATQRFARPRYLDVRLRFTSEAEIFGDHYDLLQERGDDRPLLAVKDPEETAAYWHKQLVYGLMAMDQPIAQVDYGPVFELPITIDEMVA